LGKFKICSESDYKNNFDGKKILLSQVVPIERISIVMEIDTIFWTEGLVSMIFKAIFKFRVVYQCMYIAISCFSDCMNVEICVKGAIRGDWKIRIFCVDICFFFTVSQSWIPNTRMYLKFEMVYLFFRVSYSYLIKTSHVLQPFSF